MKQRTFHLALFIAVASLAGGCGSQKGTDARYELERNVWKARMIEQRIWQDPLAVRYEELDEAIEAYQRVLATDPLAAADAHRWSVAIHTDIRKIRVAASATLAKLCSIRLQDNAGVTYFRSGLRRNDLLVRDRRGMGVVAAGTIYANIGKDPLEDKCSELLSVLAEDQVLWRGSLEMSDTLLSIPVYLVRIEAERNLGAPALEQTEVAEKFLGLVSVIWPDSVPGLMARLARADLYAILERYDDALSEIDAVLSTNHDGVNREETLLFRGEILGHGLGRYEEAESLLAVIRDAKPGTPLARAAALDLATIQIRSGRAQEGMRALRELELGGDTPAETKATAMLIRAIALFDEGDWAESLHILWRICRLLPFTRASMVAPLIILRRQVETGGAEGALGVHAKVAAFYLSAIESGSASWRYRHLVQDCLIESYLVVNDPQGAAALLEERAPAWNDDAGSVGLFKSALIYLQLLDDQENGVRMLKKCLDAFPQSRYSRLVRGHLETVSHRKAVEK